MIAMELGQYLGIKTLDVKGYHKDYYMWLMLEMIRFIFQLNNLK